MLLNSVSSCKSRFIIVLLWGLALILSGCDNPRQSQSAPSDAKKEAIPPYAWITRPADGAENLDPNVAFSGKTVSFKDHAVTYKWDFGDGAASTDPTPTHTYTAPGKYVVKLQATDTTTQLQGNVALAAICVGQPCPAVNTWTALGIFALLQASGEVAFARWAIEDAATIFFDSTAPSALTSSRLGTFVQNIYNELKQSEKEMTESVRYAFLKRWQEMLTKDEILGKGIDGFFNLTTGIEKDTIQQVTLAGAFVVRFISHFPSQAAMLTHLCERLKAEGVPATVAGRCALDTELAQSVMDTFRPMAEWINSFMRDLPAMKEFYKQLETGMPIASGQHLHSVVVESLVEPKLLASAQPLARAIEAQSETYQLIVDAWAVDNPAIFKAWRLAVDKYRQTVQNYSQRSNVAGADSDPQKELVASLRRVQQLLEERFALTLKKVGAAKN